MTSAEGDKPTVADWIAWVRAMSTEGRLPKNSYRVILTAINRLEHAGSLDTPHREWDSLPWPGGLNARTESIYRGVLRNAQRWYVEAMADPVAWRIAHPTQPTMTVYAFPLRPGLVVSVEVPADLTEGEARRMGTWLSTLGVGR